jgi:hypothetical protein
VDEAAVLAVLFAIQAAGALPEDVTGDTLVDDADRLLVLFALRSGC